MKVSVLVKTFCHERYVEQTVASVLEQDAGFPWELVVGEDASTDGTPARLREIAARHPERVRVLFRERNLGPVQNLVQTLAACRGDYVALLDGDDFWTDPGKIRRQAGLLDEDRGLSACSHDAELVDADGRPTGRRYCSPHLPRLLTLERVLKGNPIPACSLMFRRALVDELPAWFHRPPFTDWPLLVLLLTSGPIRHEPAAMAAYRVHGEGLWSGMDDARRLAAGIEMYRLFREVLGPRHERLIRVRAARLHLQLALAYDRAGDAAAMRSAFAGAFRTAGRSFPRLLLHRAVRRLVPRVLRGGLG